MLSELFPCGPFWTAGGKEKGEREVWWGVENFFRLLSGRLEMVILSTGRMGVKNTQCAWYALEFEDPRHLFLKLDLKLLAHSWGSV